jgi:hypothetical protein
MEVTRDELQQIVSQAVQQAMSTGVMKVAALPVMYKFPEDLVQILGGHVSAWTIRDWKKRGYLRTTKVGAKTFVTQESWQWFLDNHKELMENDGNRRPISN